MKLEDILKLPPDDTVKRLTKISGGYKNKEELLKDWNPLSHDVMDKEKRPDGKKIKKDEVRDNLGVIISPVVYEDDPVNRIPLAIEQDQVNIHTAFTVGNLPKLNCEPADEKEKELFKIINLIDKRNKIRFLNKKIVRSWLSETQVAEYWYAAKDESFWSKMVNKIKGAIGKDTLGENKLKCAIWSPFRGDKLYPLRDASGNFIALSREYQVKDDNDNLITKLMTVTDTMVHAWVKDDGWKVDEENTFKHGFSKMPIIYSERDNSLCAVVKPIRERLEKLISNYADCIDYNFFPKPVIEGEMTGRPTKENGDAIQIRNGGKVYYLTWNQTPESAKFEFDSLMERCYAMTKTPRLSLEALKGLGQVPSGKAFEFLFMGTLLEVDNHDETIGEHLQRRYNFLITAVGDINTYFKEPAKTLEIEPELVPFKLKDLAEAIKNAVDAYTGGVASRKTGVVMAGLVDEVEEELKLIEEEQAADNKKVE